MTTTATVQQQDQVWYTVKDLSRALAQRGLVLSIKAIRDHIQAGRINAKKDVLRPSIYVVSHQELLRLVHQGAVQE